MGNAGARQEALVPRAEGPTGLAVVWGRDGHVEGEDRGLGGQKGRSRESSALGTARSWGRQGAGRGDVSFDRRV